MSRPALSARTLRAPLSLTALILAAIGPGCIKGEVGDVPTQAIVHADPSCNTSQEALANSACRLTLGVASQEYIQQRGDKDWWVVNVEALPPRAIIHVVAGYQPGPGQDAGTFNTAVNLQINVLDSNEGVPSTSQATGVDPHGSASPKMIDLTFRYTKSNNDLFILVQDDTGLKADDLSPYSILVEVLNDPDTNEPNDSTPTPIVLTAGGGGVQGTSSGFLATPGDVDLFSVQTVNPNSVLWFRVTQDPAFPSPTPHRFRLEYILQDSGGTPIDHRWATAGSQFSPNLMQIGSARLLPTAGTYTLLVRGFIDPTNPTIIPPGDLNFRYLVEVKIVPLQDPSENNNTIVNAKGKPSPDVSLAGPGSSGRIVGRLSFVPDPDYYRVRLTGASAAPHLLHYKVTPGQSVSRFPAPVPGPKDRVLTVTTEIPGGAQGECAAGDAGVCIISAPVSNFNYPIATNLCLASTPQCLQSTRYENQDTPPKFQNLANFESVLQVPPHAANVEYFFKFEDDGNDWADDVDYFIDVDWVAEPDQAEAVPDPQRAATLGAGRTGTSLGGPLVGYLSYGIGATDTSLGIAPVTDAKDYDGRGDDVDTYAVSVPASVVSEQQLFFQWRIPATAVNQMPYDLGVNLAFCVPDGGVSCASVQTRTQTGFSQLGLIYDPGTVTSWWNTASATPLEPAYDRTLTGVAPNTEALTVFRDYACGCLEQRLIAQGGGATMFVSVFPINRTSWGLGNPYTLETGYGPYPYAFMPMGGGAAINCPTPCQFTKN